MKTKINLLELQIATMIELNQSQQQKVVEDLSKLLDEVKIFDSFDLDGIDPLENISLANFNFLREDEIQTLEVDCKDVLKQHNKVIDDFGVLKNEK